MTKYHINKHGVPAVCMAKPGNCPLGGDELHFSTMEEAEKAVEKEMAEKYGVLGVETTPAPPKICLSATGKLILYTDEIKDSGIYDNMPKFSSYEEAAEYMEKGFYEDFPLLAEIRGTGGEGKIAYIRTDRNGTKYYEDYTCTRCGGAGYSDSWWRTGKICYGCSGSGRKNKPTTFKIYTPEHAAKLEERRRKREAKRLAENPPEPIPEPTPEPEMNKSEYVGEVGEKLTIEVSHKGATSFDTQFGLMTIFFFEDEKGNRIIWRTGSAGVEDFEGTKTMTATVKEHSIYRDQRQTRVIRPKFE